MERSWAQQIARVLVLLGTLTGCGAAPDPVPIGFINQTQHLDADLWSIWHAAQQNIARQVDLNPLERSFQAVEPDLLPGDERALRMEPHQLRVAAEPDIPSGALLAATSAQRSDPTGLITCPQPCNVHYAAAYSRYDRPLTMYAQSWEFNGNNFALILQYEFENHILHALGYNLRWR